MRAIVILVFSIIFFGASCTTEECRKCSVSTYSNQMAVLSSLRTVGGGTVYRQDARPYVLQDSVFNEVCDLDDILFYQRHDRLIEIRKGEDYYYQVIWNVICN